jgi:hypothetical protein
MSTSTSLIIYRIAAKPLPLDVAVWRSLCLACGLGAKRSVSVSKRAYRSRPPLLADTDFEFKEEADVEAALASRHLVSKMQDGGEPIESIAAEIGPVLEQWNGSPPCTLFSRCLVVGGHVESLGWKRDLKDSKDAGPLRISTDVSVSLFGYGLPTDYKAFLAKARANKDISLLTNAIESIIGPTSLELNLSY